MKIFLVGGFLGSGKTTAIQQAVHYLKRDGKSAGVVTNDQGDQLVDTQFLRDKSIAVKEVTGSCFCCNYNELDKSLRSLNAEIKPDAVFAESVGSCTDLVATIIKPLLHFNDSGFEPVLSVFVDVRLLIAHIQKAARVFKKNVEYIFEKQLEEADILVVNKIDLLNEEELQLAKKQIEAAYAGRKIVYLNALSDEHIKQWVDVIFSYQRNASSGKPLEIDYDQYGEGEAELAWLDGEIGIQTNNRTAIKTGVALVNDIYERVLKQDYPVGHLKFLLSDGQWQKKISFTAVPSKAFELKASTVEMDRIVILINARVQTHPEKLKQIVEEAILASENLYGCKITEGQWKGFKPGYPRPTYRMS